MVDKLIHHATILELNTESYRIKTAHKNIQKQFEQEAKKLENEKVENYIGEHSV